MQSLLYITVMLAASAPGWPFSASAPQKPHPAVVRIIVPERNGASLGSGTLVAVNERHGLVLTNWHVVRDGNGMVTVVFPDGFHSGATVLKVDRDWDLAALIIWRPHVGPVKMSTSIPRKGEPLTIAGYGSGKFRMATGRCTEYVSPGRNLPFEMLQLSAGARQGDSGGPILNQRGELAGVLFGAFWGTTTGSHCGRVRSFLGPLAEDFDKMLDTRTMIADRAAPNAKDAPAAADRVQGDFQPRRDNLPSVETVAERSPPQSRPLHSPSHDSGQTFDESPQASQDQNAGQFVAVRPGGWRPASESQEQGSDGQNAAQAVEEPIELPDLSDIAGDTWLSRLKTMLAVVGLFAMFFQCMRLLGSDG